MAGPEQSDKKEDDLFTAPGDSDIPDWLKPVNEAGGTSDRRVGGRWLVPVLAATVTVLFLAVIWFLYVLGAGEDLTGEPRLVKAPEGPVRQAPEDRGGIEVPHQDKLVYDRLTGEPRQIEKSLRPPPEEPVEPRVDSETAGSDERSAAAGDTGQAASEPANESEADGPDAPADDAPPTPGSVATASGRGPGIEAEPVSDPASNPDPEPQRESEPDTAASAGLYRVQLAAFASTEVAEASWRRLANRFPDLLGRLEHDLQRVERGGRVLYRLRAGAFGDRDAAVGLCSRLKDRGQDCLLVEP